MILTEENQSIYKTPVLVSLCPSQIPHGLASVVEWPATNYLSHGTAQELRKGDTSLDRL
jgi:hypothetical protein